MAVPKIRANVKRTSAIELQKVLKKGGHYQGSLDGLYGPGTKAAYAKWVTASGNMQKYQMLNQHREEWTPKRASSPLQSSLHLLGTEPAPALRQLEKSNSALALAYRAYYGFHTRGAQRQVDIWMNKAIQQAFKNQVKSSITFDPTATYSYRDLNQILHHLAQIHSVTEAEAAVPCWLFQRHPEAAANAFATVSSYRMEDCDRFTQWETLQLVQVISQELDPNPTNSRTMAESYASIRAGLFVAPLPLSTPEQKAIEAWNTSLWKGMDEWTAKDPIHQKMTEPLKVAYYQSMVLLEDYYMNAGFKAREAKGLALAVLQTIVSPHLEGYRR